MKNFTCLLFTVLLVAITKADAQIKKGSVFLGGNIGGSTQTVKRDGTKINKANGLVISPVFGKSIRENLIVGVDMGFSFFESKNSANSTLYTASKSNNYSAGVFLRKYKAFGKSEFSMFVQGNLSMNYSNNDFDIQNPYYSNTKNYSVGVSAYPGISYAVSKRLQLETGFNNLISLSYFSETGKLNNTPTITEKRNGVSVNTSLNNLSSIYIGFRVLLSKS